MLPRSASRYPLKRLVESCCGGLINASIMAILGSSQVFYGGSVAYNTKQAQKFLMNDSKLHSKLLERPPPSAAGESEADNYIQSKFHWTAETAKTFCEQKGVHLGRPFVPKISMVLRSLLLLYIAGKDKDGTAWKFWLKMMSFDIRSRDA